MKKYLIAGGMVIAGLGCMYVESSYQPAPGVGFGIAMILIMGAAFVATRSND